MRAPPPMPVMPTTIPTNRAAMAVVISLRWAAGVRAKQRGQGGQHVRSPARQPAITSEKIHNSVKHIRIGVVNGGRGYRSTAGEGSGVRASRSYSWPQFCSGQQPKPAEQSAFLETLSRNTGRSRWGR